MVTDFLIFTIQHPLPFFQFTPFDVHTHIYIHPSACLHSMPPGTSTSSNYHQQINDQLEYPFDLTTNRDNWDYEELPHDRHIAIPRQTLALASTLPTVSNVRSTPTTYGKPVLYYGYAFILFHFSD